MSSRKSFRKSISNIFKGTEDTHNWGPLLIAIGPNCCGKSTFVKGLDEDVTEFSTESVAELHVQVPVEIAAKVWQDKISGDVVQTLRGQTVYNVPMLERLKKMRGLELTLVALLFAKLLPLKDFEEKMEPLLKESDYGDIFMSAVRELYQTRGVVLKTKTFDIFVGEAVDAATAQTTADLKAAIKTNEGVICWGNTNLNPDFYKDALKVADKYQRVVRFVRWGRELPIVPLKELFRRSIQRFLETGRYVSSTKLDKFRKHAEFFISKAGGNTHMDYASLAEYDMNDIGCVSHKVSPITKKPAGQTVNNRYVVWNNTGLVYNIAQGPPISPSALAEMNRSMSRSASNNGGGVSPSHNSDDNDLEPKNGISPRAKDGKRTPSLAGSNTSSTSISFSAAANKSMNKIPSDPNLLPLSASSLQAVSEAAAAAAAAVESKESRSSDLGEEGIAYNSSKQQSVEAAAAAVGGSPSTEVLLQPSSGASKHSPVKPLVVDSLSGKEPQKPPTAPPTPSRASSGPIRQSSNGGATSSPTPAAAPPSPSGGGGGFSLLGMLGIKTTSHRESPTIGNDASPAAKFVIDDSAPTTQPHHHNPDHSVMLQDSVKLTHIHQREASLNLNKEKSVGHAADFKKSNSLNAEVHFAPSVKDNGEGTPVVTALSPAVFVVDTDSPRPGVTHQPSVNHEVHIQDSIKLGHIHEEEKHLHPHPDEGPIGHPKDHVRHPIFVEPKRQNTDDDDEIGFTSTKSATFVLDDHSPRLTHQKSEQGEVLLQDSVKLKHIHLSAVHDKPLFNPVIVRNDSFDLSETKSAEKEKKINRTRSSSPPTRKLSFRASLVEEIPVPGDGSEGSSPIPTMAGSAVFTESAGSSITSKSAASSLFPKVDNTATTPAVPATFILDEKPPSLHHQPSLNHEVHIQDSVKLAHIHHEHQSEHQSEHHPASIHVVKIELTPEQNALQSDKHITFDQHSPKVVPRSPDNGSSRGNGKSPLAPSSGKLAPLAGQNGQESSEEEDDGVIVATLTPPTPKKDKDPNAFSCVLPNLFCV